MIVSNTSPLIFLGRLGLLHVLPELFDEVVVPPAVHREATSAGHRPGAVAVERAMSDGLITLQPPQSDARVQELSELVDAGEAAAIVVALELGTGRVLMDDRAGRRLAQALGLTPLGTLGEPIAGARAGLVHDLPQHLDTLQVAGFRMSAALTEAVLAAVIPAEDI